MKRLFIVISTERRNETLADELASTLEEIKKTVPLKLQHLIAIRSVSLSSKSCQLNDVDILEFEHDVESNNENIEQLKISDTLSEDQNINNEEEFIANDFFKFSESLHSLADNFCEAASQKLCILWIIDKYAPCPSEVLEFYASLQRFHDWHNGSLYFVTKDSEMVQDWLQFLLPFTIVESSSKAIERELESFWQGSLAFSVEEKLGWTLYPEVTLTGVHESFNPFIIDSKKEVTHSQYVLPICEVFYFDVDLGSIPWPYIQRGSLCKMEAVPSITSEQKENLLELFKKMTADQGVGTLVRIRHSHLPPTVDPKLHSQEWKQRIAEGNFDLTPSLQFKGHHQCLVLVVLPDCAAKDYVYCLALQDPSVYGEDIVKMVMQESLKPKEVNLEEKEKVLQLLGETGELGNVQTAAFSHLLLNLPKSIKKHFSKTGQSLEAIWDSMKLAIERAASREISNILFANMKPTQILPVDKIIPAEVMVEKENWPEYQALQEAERISKKSLSRRVSSGDFLCGIAPPVASDSLVGVQASQMLKFFRTDGNPINSENLLDSSGLAKESNLIKSNLPLDVAKEKNWSDALHIKHHGFYYNACPESEKFELRCNRYRERNIRSEFASTCTVFQNHQSALVSSRRAKKSIGVCKRGDSPQTAARSTSEIDTMSLKSEASHNMPRRSPRKLQRTASVASRILRRSPRKRGLESPEEIRASDLMRPSRSKKARMETKPAVFKPAELNELHTRKLRSVIMNVLDSKGISIKDPLFKLCFRKMFQVCKPFALDVIGQGPTTKSFETIAKSQVNTIIEFEKMKTKRR